MSILPPPADAPSTSRRLDSPRPPPRPSPPQVKPLADTGDHAARLEAFYAPQAAAYDSFRANFLHGRKPMLAACAARLPEAGPLVWVDLGGGTAENVASMAKYIDLARFSTIYVVDLCPALCAAARAKAAAAGWANVVVVEADACGWAPPAAAGPAHLVTFSYSLSMIPAFHAAIDAAVGYLDADVGLLGAADFYASAKWDLPLRQQRWATRFFWRGLFDRDGIDVGPERRAYLDHALARVWEDNGAGAVPYVPLLKAPYYCAVYRVPKLAALLAERRAEAPPLFPPSFIYTQSWEDPAADAPWLAVGPGDVCLTLTSGGCNALALCLAGAAAVHSVDCNPAQNALLELKAAAVRRLDHEDVWRLFGEGRHTDASALFERELAPFLSQAALRFWRPRVGRYFDPSGGGLHEAGGMGKVVRGARLLARALGLADAVAALAAAPTLAKQREVYEALWPVRALRAAPAPLRAAAAAAAEAAIFNRLALWLGGGVPRRQADLIRADGLSVAAYAARTFDGVARGSHLAGDNYFYLSCLLGRFARGNCPAYLTRAGHAALRAGALDALRVEHGFFMVRAAAFYDLDCRCFLQSTCKTAHPPNRPPTARHRPRPYPPGRAARTPVRRGHPHGPRGLARGGRRARARGRARGAGPPRRPRDLALGRARAAPRGVGRRRGLRGALRAARGRRARTDGPRQHVRELPRGDAARSVSPGRAGARGAARGRARAASVLLYFWGAPPLGGAGHLLLCHYV